MSETIVKHEIQYPLGALRQERLGFVARAFSSADILMELDPQGEIMFAAGSTEVPLGMVQDDLVARPSFNIGDSAAPRDGGRNRNLSGEG